MCGGRRGEIELCARLLGIAAAGLNENPGLLGFVILAKLGLLALSVPLLAFSALAYTNGGLVANSKPPSTPHVHPIASLDILDILGIHLSKVSAIMWHASANLLYMYHYLLALC